ncbi:MAG: thioredoxin-dependent thiol peroxidase [Rhodospirillaceae bacterium]|nr:MAG: thioredoxin-dependent thiol peroxidase [Rhodospirillaceae bacterium]
MTLSPGDIAPAFDLPTDGDGQLALCDLKGKKVVLYFYPRDSTPGCTTESNDFTDLHDQFSDANTVIVGASKDSVKRHNNFKAKYEFPFTLVSDEEGVLCEAYGVWVLKKNYGKEYMGIERSTFLIDEDGKILEVWRKVRVKEHAQKVLTAVQAL